MGKVKEALISKSSKILRARHVAWTKSFTIIHRQNKLGDNGGSCHLLREEVKCSSGWKSQG